MIEYLKRLFNLELTKKEVRASGFTLSQDLVERELLITNGTVEGALWALNNRSAAFNIAGGTHHASANKAEGFCLLNDQAIASRYLLDNTNVSQILIIDLMYTKAMVLPKYLKTLIMYILSVCMGLIIIHTTNLRFRYTITRQY